MKRFGLFGVFDCSALTPHTHRNPRLLRGFGQAQVDRLCIGSPAGHGGDQDRRGQSFAEQTQACIDLFEIQLRQRLVNEMIIFESSGQPGTDVLFEIDFDVVRFSLVNPGLSRAGSLIARIEIWRNF